MSCGRREWHTKSDLNLLEPGRLLLDMVVILWIAALDKTGSFGSQSRRLVSAQLLPEEVDLIDDHTNKLVNDTHQPCHSLWLVRNAGGGDSASKIVKTDFGIVDLHGLVDQTVHGVVASLDELVEVGDKSIVSSVARSDRARQIALSRPQLGGRELPKDSHTEHDGVICSCLADDTRLHSASEHWISTSRIGRWYSGLYVCRVVAYLILAVLGVEAPVWHHRHGDLCRHCVVVDRSVDVSVVDMCIEVQLVLEVVVMLLRRKHERRIEKALFCGKKSGIIACAAK